MREAIGGGWIFTLVIIFVVIFSGYLAISVNYSKAFKIKNRIVSIIEEQEGMSAKAEDEIENYLSGMGYMVYGRCAGDETGFPKESYNSKYLYCVSKKEVGTDVNKKTYYYIRLFFRFDLPVLENILTFSVKGETDPIYFANDGSTSKIKTRIE